jgi:hypothetical protein
MLMLKTYLAGLVAAIVLALVAVPLAAATDPNDTQYGNPSSQVSTEEPVTSVKGQTQSNAQPEAQPGTLPFTGLDLGVALGLGVVLVGGGVLLRRAGRRTET